MHRKLKPTGSERVVWGDADQKLFPGCRNAVGANGQYDLLGKLYAAGKGCALSKKVLLCIFRQIPMIMMNGKAQLSI